MSTDCVSSAFLLTLDENLREVFGSYCSSHEDPNFSFCFEFADKLIDYKNTVQFAERKEVGYQIMEMIEHSAAKVHSFAEKAIVDGLLEEFNKYELKAKWAHFIKEEKLNTSLCVFANDFFNPLIESSSQFLQCLVYPLFLTSDHYFFELNSWPYTGDLLVLFDNFCRNYSIMVQSPTTTSTNSMLSQFTSASQSTNTNTNESLMKVKYLLYQVICDYHSSEEYKKRELGLDIYKTYFIDKNTLTIVKTLSTSIDSTEMDRLIIEFSEYSKNILHQQQLEASDQDKIFSSRFSTDGYLVTASELFNLLDRKLRICFKKEISPLFLKSQLYTDYQSSFGLSIMINSNFGHTIYPPVVYFGDFKEPISSGDDLSSHNSSESSSGLLSNTSSLSKIRAKNKLKTKNRDFDPSKLVIVTRRSRSMSLPCSGTESERDKSREGKLDTSREGGERDESRLEVSFDPSEASTSVPYSSSDPQYISSGDRLPDKSRTNSTVSSGSNSATTSHTDSNNSVAVSPSSVIPITSSPPKQSLHDPIFVSKSDSGPTTGQTKPKQRGRTNTDIGSSRPNIKREKRDNDSDFLFVGKRKSSKTSNKVSRSPSLPLIWSLDEKYFKLFCLSKKEYTPIYVFYEVTKKFRETEDVKERKELGAQIFEDYFIKNAKIKIAFKDQEIANDIVTKVAQYELKAKWAHFVKEELKNPSLCVYTQDLYQILENEMSVFLQQQVVPKFFASPQYNEFKTSLVEAKSARAESSPTVDQDKVKVRSSRSKSVERQVTQKFEKSSNEIRKAIIGSDGSSSSVGSSLPLLTTSARSSPRHQKKLKAPSILKARTSVSKTTPISSPSLQQIETEIVVPKQCKVRFPEPSTTSSVAVIQEKNMKPIYKLEKDYFGSSWTPKVELYMKDIFKQFIIQRKLSTGTMETAMLSQLDASKQSHLIVLCCEDKTNLGNQGKKTNEYFKCLCLSAFGVTEFPVVVNSSSLLGTVSQVWQSDNERKIFVEALSKEIEDYLKNTLSISICLVREFTPKKVGAEEELMAIEKHILNEIAVHHITVGVSTKTELDDFTIKTISNNKTISPALEYFLPLITGVDLNNTDENNENTPNNGNNVESGNLTEREMSRKDSEFLLKSDNTVKEKQNNNELNFDEENDGEETKEDGWSLSPRISTNAGASSTGETTETETNCTSRLPNGEIKSEWNGINLTWFIAAKMSREGIRRCVGNSNCMIIFDESGIMNPFDPSKLYLGKVTNFVIVVKPIKLTEGYAYRIGAFLHYEFRWSNIEKELTESKMTKKAEKMLQEEVIFRMSSCHCSYPCLPYCSHYYSTCFISNLVEPFVQKNYVVDEAHIKSFIMILLHNAVYCSFKHHLQVRNLIRRPIDALLEKFALNYSL